MNLKKYLPELKEIKNIRYKYQFTVFVPVFNSSRTLHRVFNSLDAQTYKNFEVIIINDGSTDNSHEIIHEYLDRTNLPVNYIHHEVNKHKMGCLMEAIKIAEGEFFIVLDADDACSPDALDVFYAEYNRIPAEIKPMISGISCCCVDQHGALIGDCFPEDPFYKSSFDKNIYHLIKGEKWGFNKTDILKSISINDGIYGRGLIPEGYIWFLIAKEEFITKYINKSLRVYYIEENSKSLSSLGYDKKAFGMAVFAIAFVNWFHEKHLRKAFKHFLMRLYSLLKASNYLEFSFKEYVSSIDNNLLKVVFAVSWPFRKVM